MGNGPRHSYHGRPELRGDKKILLIVPIPRELFQKNGDDFRPVFSGERINGCAVYHTSTFLYALETDDFD